MKEKNSHENIQNYEMKKKQNYNCFNGKGNESILVYKNVDIVH